jgi:hypothetical protein
MFATVGPQVPGMELGANIAAKKGPARKQALIVSVSSINF